MSKGEYVLVSEDEIQGYYDGDGSTMQYVFENKQASKRWYINYKKQQNEVEYIICSGSWEDFKNRPNCIPESVKEYVQQLLLLGIL